MTNSENPILITGAARSGTSGIYQLVCKATGKIYIGSSINMVVRKARHLKALGSGTHHNPYLQKAYNKYGEHNFAFYILDFCDSEELLLQEQRFLDKLQTRNPYNGFNLCPVAGSRLGTTFTEESKHRLSIARRGKYTGKANHNYGKPQSKATRKKISESLKGRFAGKNNPCYGRVVSKETRKKIGEAGKGRPAWNKGLTKDDPRVKKYGNSQKGKTISQEHREKISQSLCGHQPTEKTRQKLRVAQKRRWSRSGERQNQSDRLMGIPSGMLGKKHSEQTKQKMRDSHRKRLEANHA